MALLITCPDCEAENRVEDSKKGKNVPCKTCGVSFKVGEKAKFVEDPKETKKSDSDLDDEDKPKKKRSGRTDLDDEDDEKGKGRKSRRRGGDDDDDDERRGRARGHTHVAGNAPTGVIIGGAVVGVIIVGVVIYFIISSMNKVKSEIEKNIPGGTAEFDQKLAGVKNGDRGACDWFKGQDPNKNALRRSEVASALEGALAATDPGAVMEASRALAKWGSKENVPALIKTLERPFLNPNDENGVREAVIETLGNLKDPQASKVLVDFAINNPKLRQRATEALNKIGTPAETEAQRLLSSGDMDTQIAGCRLLRVIGTQASVAQLNTVADTSKNSKDGKTKTLNKEANEAVVILRKK